MSEYCKNCARLVDGIRTIIALTDEGSNDPHADTLLGNINTHAKWLIEESETTEINCSICGAKPKKTEVFYIGSGKYSCGECLDKPQTPSEAIDKLVKKESE